MFEKRESFRSLLRIKLMVVEVGLIGCGSRDGDEAGLWSLYASIDRRIDARGLVDLRITMTRLDT